MGDAGSMFLGYVLAVTSIAASAKGSAAVALVVPIVALALPIADTLLALGRRWLRGSPLFLADRGHIHHKLLALGLTQRQVALLLYGVCVMLGMAAVALGSSSGVKAAAVLAGVAVLGLFGLRRLGYLRLRSLRRVLEIRRRNVSLRAHMGDITARLRRSAEMAEVWESVRRAKRELGAAAVSLRFSHGLRERLSAPAALPLAAPGCGGPRARADAAQPPRRAAGRRPRAGLAPGAGARPRHRAGGGAALSPGASGGGAPRAPEPRPRAHAARSGQRDPGHRHRRPRGVRGGASPSARGAYLSIASDRWVQSMSGDHHTPKASTATEKAPSITW